MEFNPCCRVYYELIQHVEQFNLLSIIYTLYNINPNDAQRACANSSDYSYKTRYIEKKVSL